jgi:hypothetical protein
MRAQSVAPVVRLVCLRAAARLPVPSRVRVFRAGRSIGGLDRGDLRDPRTNDNLGLIAVFHNLPSLALEGRGSALGVQQLSLLSNLSKRSVRKLAAKGFTASERPLEAHFRPTADMMRTGGPDLRCAHGRKELSVRPGSTRTNRCPPTGRRPDLTAEVEGEDGPQASAELRGHEPRARRLCRRRSGRPQGL